MSYKLFEYVIDNYFRASIPYTRDYSVNVVEEEINNGIIDRIELKKQVEHLLKSKTLDEMIQYLIDVEFLYNYQSQYPIYSMNCFKYFFWDIIYPERRFKDDDILELAMNVSELLSSKLNKGKWILGSELIQQLNNDFAKQYEYYHFFYFRAEMDSLELYIDLKYIEKDKDQEFIFRKV